MSRLPEPVQRLLSYAGKTRREVTNPCITAREAIAIADWLTATLPRALREGEVMGAYIDFDRSADKTWTPAEYLVKFGLFISERTAAKA